MARNAYQKKNKRYPKSYASVNFLSVLEELLNMLWDVSATPKYLKHFIVSVSQLTFVMERIQVMLTKIARSAKNTPIIEELDANEVPNHVVHFLDNYFQSHPFSRQDILNNTRVTQRT